MRIWLVTVETYEDGELEGYEVIPYASEQTARQHEERANRNGYQHASVRSAEILTKLREY